MKVVFRVDASFQIGTGHVMRCLTLADALRDIGADCVFISCDYDGNLNEYIRQRHYKVIELFTRDVGGLGYEYGDLDHSSWLVWSQEEDAERSLVIINELSCDILIVDHYALDYRWEQTLRSGCDKVFVIDDLADRIHDCVMLLDQNWFEDHLSERYKDLVPRDTELLLGPKYALLKPEYSCLHEIMPKRDGSVRRLLIFMGGADPGDETSKVVSSLTTLGLENLLIDVILGVNHPNPFNVIQLASRHKNILVHNQQSTLAGWMMRADLMISGGGATSWERMCLGLPAIVISIAVNQTKTNQALMKSGYIDFLGEYKKVSSEMIFNAVQRCIADPNRLKCMSQKAMRLVDGLGAVLVANKLLNLR